MLDAQKGRVEETTFWVRPFVHPGLPMKQGSVDHFTFQRMSRYRRLQIPMPFFKDHLFLDPSRAIFLELCKLSTNEPRFYTM